jgi:hypothetical protein
LLVGQVVVELVGQRRQRAAGRPSEHDLPHQVAGQLFGQHGGWHSQNVRRAIRPGIIQHSQRSLYRRLQHFQHRHRPGPCRILHGLAEGFPDHRRELFGLLSG